MPDAIIRTPEELATLENAWAEAFEDGTPGAGTVLDLLLWLANPDADPPMPS